MEHALGGIGEFPFTNNGEVLEIPFMPLKKHHYR